MSKPREVIKGIALQANKLTMNLAVKNACVGVSIHTDVTDHLIERAEERSVPHYVVATAFSRLFNKHTCELLWCMTKKDLTYLNLTCNVGPVVIACRTRCKGEGRYSIAFTSIFKGPPKEREGHYNIMLGEIL